jgi:sulfatase maturation enzyme AslB (radical SAM superfamily)
MINQRLFNWYGIDTNKDLQINTRCPRPFDTVLIDKQGSCYLCECTSWLPQSAGNLHIESLDQILNSATAKTLQNSIQDGSYRYCNNKRCSYLLDPKRKSRWSTLLPNKQIQHIRLAIDNSCNLRCPSCRKNLIFIKEGAEFKRRIQLANKINEWLSCVQHPLKVHIGSDGDPFASQVYRHFMLYTPIQKNIKYSILTNGILFKEFAGQIPHIIENLTDLGVSIDGASKETYEKLRLGGHWEKINENLKFICELKQKYNFKFRIHFVVQKDNYHEMEKIIELGQQYNTDQVWLDRIQNWNVMKNFEEQDIFNSYDYKFYLNQIQDVKKKLRDGFVEFPTLIS